MSDLQPISSKQAWNHFQNSNLNLNNPSDKKILDQATSITNSIMELAALIRERDKLEGRPPLSDPEYFTLAAGLAHL